MQSMLRLILCLLGLAMALPANAVEAPEVQRLGRYMPLYPGLYVAGSIARDPRDKVFDASGDEQDTVLSNASGKTEFPETRLELDFQWYFPLFADSSLPFFSERLHTARATLRGAYPGTDGALNDFNRANGLEDEQGGLGDLSLEFGSFLAGSAGWRERERDNYALLLLLGIDVPVGEYDSDAPVNAGSNQYAYYTTLGGNWRVAPGWFAEGGVTYKIYQDNDEPAFGALYPTELGDLLILDLSLGKRLRDNVYLNVFVQHQDGDSNNYDNPRFAINPPEPPPLMENLPAAGSFEDEGTELLTAGASLRFFISENLLAGLHVILPLKGESGEFVLPFRQQLAGCEVTDTCMPMDSGQSVIVDGLGTARSYASNIYLFSLSWSVGRGDAWL